MNIVVMGVTSCGKSTIGKLLATRLSVPFIEGDEFHPEENIKKMSKGIPLNDDDRSPWLKALSHELQIHEKKKGAVLACSALRESYRTILQEGLHEKIVWIYLEGSEDVIRERMKERKKSFYAGDPFAIATDNNGKTVLCLLLFDREKAGSNRESNRRSY